MRSESWHEISPIPVNSRERKQKKPGHRAWLSSF
jgi:hypothetical protein